MSLLLLKLACKPKITAFTYEVGVPEFANKSIKSLRAYGGNTSATHKANETYW